jgi:hypothetical protein
VALQNKEFMTIQAGNPSPGSWSSTHYYRLSDLRQKAAHRFKKIQEAHSEDKIFRNDSGFRGQRIKSNGTTPERIIRIAADESQIHAYRARLIARCHFAFSPLCKQSNYAMRESTKRKRVITGSEGKRNWGV